MKPLLTLAIIALLGSFITPSLHAQPNCTAGFTDSIDSVTVYFTNQASGTYNWIMYDFGDNNQVLNTPNPVHTYASEGIYEVCQFVQDTLNFCFDATCDTLILGNQTCYADFDWFDQGLEVMFDNYSFGLFDSVYWDFGDGNGSSQMYPTHIYSQPGSYTTCLSLFDSLGSLCDSTCFTFSVDSNSSCEAYFESSTNGLIAEFLNFSAGTYNAVAWDFGDGSQISQQHDPTHVYQTPGTYEVCLTIFDTVTGSCFDNYCDNVTVTGGGGGACSADFEYEAEELYVEFDNTSTGAFQTSFWDYGDGSAPSMETTHTYSEPGEYEVCLTIGALFPFCFDQYCETIEVYEFTCEPEFTYNFDLQTNTYYFTNTTQVGNVTSELWEFGDGNSSNFSNPSYSYNLPGIYQVCLTTYDEDELCGVYCQDVQVYPLGTETVENQTMSIYPNPSDGKVSLQNMSSQGRVEVSLLDAAGHVVDSRSIDGSENRIDLDYSELPAGIYMMTVMPSNGDMQSFKLVLNR